jgi:hypothetical protein
MIGRNRRGNRRHVSMKARLALATAVLAGGAAIGAVAVATGNHSGPSTADSAGYTINFNHTVSESTALNTALSDWTSSQSSQQKALTALTEMPSMRSFSTTWHGRTELAVQRGVIALATKHWLLVKSSNGSLHLWLLSGNTHTVDVSNSTKGTAAMTGNTAATTAAMQQGNMAPAATVMGGSTATVNSLNNPAPKPATFTVTIANSSETITITITSTTATVAPTSSRVATQVAQQTGTTGTSLTKTTQPTFASSDHVKRGDLVLVAGVVKHGFLYAQLVLFSAPGQNVTPPKTTPSSTTAPTPNTSVSSTPAVSSTHS